MKTQICIQFHVCRFIISHFIALNQASYCRQLRARYIGIERFFSTKILILCMVIQYVLHIQHRNTGQLLFADFFLDGARMYAARVVFGHSDRLHRSFTAWICGSTSDTRQQTPFALFTCKRKSNYLRLAYKVCFYSLHLLEYSRLLK